MAPAARRRAVPGPPLALVLLLLLLPLLLLVLLLEWLPEATHARLRRLGGAADHDFYRPLGLRWIDASTRIATAAAIREGKDNLASYAPDATAYAIAMVADMDAESSAPAPGAYAWRSMLQLAEVTYEPTTATYGLRCRPVGELPLRGSGTAPQARGLELSDLVHYRGRLYTCDDQSGTVYGLWVERSLAGALRPVMAAWAETRGGTTAPQLKCEWMTVAGGRLLVGGYGREITATDGRVEHEDNAYVRAFAAVAASKHSSPPITLDWRPVYGQLRRETGTERPHGYITHEAVEWCTASRRWIFAPRKMATRGPYAPEVDAVTGAGILFIADPALQHVVHVPLRALPHPAAGFASVRVLPHHPDHLLALMTVECGDHVESYLAVVDLHDGHYRMPPVSLGRGLKFEGVEVLPSDALAAVRG